MLTDVPVGADALVAVDEVEAGPAVPAGVHLAVVGVDLAVAALEARRAGAGVPRHPGDAGRAVLAGVGRADVKVGLELAVVAVEAGRALAGVVVFVSRLKWKINS